MREFEGRPGPRAANQFAYFLNKERKNDKKRYTFLRLDMYNVPLCKVVTLLMHSCLNVYRHMYL